MTSRATDGDAFDEAVVLLRQFNDMPDPCPHAGNPGAVDFAQVRVMIDDDLVRARRARALDPERPFVRGTAHNPDNFFLARETVNSFYAAVPSHVQTAMDRLAALEKRVEEALIEVLTRLSRRPGPMSALSLDIRETVRFDFDARKAPGAGAGEAFR